MTRRSVVLTISCVFLSVALLALVLAGLLRYQYRWYKQAWLPPGPERLQHSQDCLKELTDLFTAFGGLDWDGKFTDVQINSFLEEGLLKMYSRPLPEGISEPRVCFEKERIHLGFRYGNGLFSTVISIDLRLWLAPQDRNVLVLELEGFRAGALPISTRSVLEKVSEFGRDQGIGVAWYRDQETGHPVAVLRFQDDQPKPTVELIAVQPGPGAIRIRGRCTTDSPPPHGPVAAPGAVLNPTGH